jgi:hypothetical protein
MCVCVLIETTAQGKVEILQKDETGAAGDEVPSGKDSVTAAVKVRQGCLNMCVVGGWAIFQVRVR